MSKPLLNICTQAIKKLKQISLQSEFKAAFIGVKGGGCNGLRYIIEPLKEPAVAIDEKMSIEGTEIVVCGRSLMHLIGTEITWEKDFMGEGFRFSNPNATGSCGCGETFSV